MYRSDYIGPEPSARLKALIAKIGGMNVFGQPNYRLVHSEFRRTPSGGTWIEWDSDLTISERKDGVATPIRRVVETRMILMYPNTLGKWILEKWCPPSSYGTPKEWSLPITSGGTMLYIPTVAKLVATLGQYPWKGDYENYGYAFPTEALTEAVVMTAIGRIERSIDAMPSTPEGRVLRKCFSAVQREELKEREYRAFCNEVLDDAGFAFHGQPFVGAGRKRPHSSKHYLNKLGITAHHID